MAAYSPTAGSLKSFWVLFYWILIITPDPSDEVEVEPPPSPPPPLVSDSVNVTMPPNPSSGSSAPGSPPTEAPPNNGDHHPATRIVQERDLGKIIIAFAIPIVMWVVTFGRNQLSESEVSFLLILVSLGFTAILYGIQLKGILPKFSQIVEAFGIAMVSISFFTIIAFFLPPEASWVPFVCMVLCALPLGIALWQPPPPPPLI